MSIKGIRYFINISLLVALCGLIAISHWYVRQQHKEQIVGQWIQHTYRVIENLEKLTTAISLVEMSQRNYLITQQDEFLKIFVRQKEEVFRLSEQLVALVKDNPLQANRVVSLIHLLNQRIKFLDNTLDKFQNAGLNAAIANIKAGTGNALMRQTLFMAEEMKNLEFNLLKQRQKYYEEHSRRIKIIAKYGFVLSMLILLACFVLLNMLLISRLKAEQKSKQNEKLLADVNLQLKENLELVTIQNSSTLLLNEMVGFLQLCESQKKAYEIIKKYAAKLLPQTSGSIYMLNFATQYLVLVGKWNEPVLAEKKYPAADYLVLKPGTVNIIDGTEANLSCIHVKENEVPIVPHVCLPLYSQNHMFGVILVEFNANDKASLMHTKVKEYLDLLMPSFAKQIALALSNIRLREDLHDQSIRDPLTNLYNRRFMKEFLSKEVAHMSRKQQPLAILMIDIDNFKNYNDTYGHDVGDYVLRELSKILVNNVRKDDIVCRYGGEEFTIIMSETNANAALEKAHKLEKILQNFSLKFEDIALMPFTLSQGIAVFPTDGDSANNLIKAADQALYAAKEGGRNQIKLYKDLH